MSPLPNFTNSPPNPLPSFAWSSNNFRDRPAAIVLGCRTALMCLITPKPGGTGPESWAFARLEEVPWVPVNITCDMYCFTKTTYIYRWNGCSTLWDCCFHGRRSILQRKSLNEVIIHRYPRLVLKYTLYIYIYILCSYLYTTNMYIFISLYIDHVCTCPATLWPLSEIVGL